MLSWRVCLFGLVNMMLSVASYSYSSDLLHFPNAQQDEQYEADVARYRLILSELKRADAVTFAEKEQYLSGELQRQLFRIGRKFTFDEVVRFYEAQFRQDKILYQCQGLDCGSSHFWSTQVFDNPLLVTRESDKYYIAVERKTETGLELVTLFIAQRATRQIYVNVDRLPLDKPIKLVNVTAADLQQILRRSSGWLEGFETIRTEQGVVLDIDGSDVLLNTLSSLTGPDREHINLLVYCFDHSDMQKNLMCSDQLSEQLKTQLSPSGEISIHSHGALTELHGRDKKPSLFFIYWPNR